MPSKKRKADSDEEEVVEGYGTEFEKLSNSNLEGSQKFGFFGIQFVSFAVNMMGVSEKVADDLAANMESKETIEQYLNGKDSHLLLL